MIPQIVRAGVLGIGNTPPSERVNLALIGCGGRGMTEGVIYAGSDLCQMVAVCDPREDRRNSARDWFNANYARKQKQEGWRSVATYNDFRDVLAQPDIDALYIAAPDHWHVPITIAAARAGKDMHTEKPLGLSINQDLAARAAVRRYARIFQYGAEGRSFPHSRQAIELVLNGRIGKVQQIYVIAPPGSSGGKPAPVLPVPKGFDYDLWLGPAPEAPFCHDRCLTSQGVWFNYDYALGFIAGWGAHPLDKLQWWADYAGRGVPVSYSGTGVLPDGGLFNTITHWDMHCRYQDGLLVRYLDSQTAAKYSDVPVQGIGDATIFMGETGWVSLSYNNGDLRTHPAALKEAVIGPEEIHLERSESHQVTWIECVRQRKDPVDPIETAVRSDLISHLSNICIRVGRPVQWDPVRETIVNDETARGMMSRAVRAPWGQYV